MTILNKAESKQFLANTWQQRSQLFSGAIKHSDSIVSKDDLFKLASDDHCEPRVISGQGLTDNWQCHHGPFSEVEFSGFGEKNWTLLVQGLDQKNEKAADLLDQFVFLPKWRLEDIMASYASIGGGVGPHFDYYDVFLIQVSGSREWRLGQRCDQTSVLQDNQDVKLLAEFDCQQVHQASQGDMLYIPAGLSHWGIATSDDCITLSVGFRAPSHNEVLIRSLDLLAEQLSKQDQSNRFQDTEQSFDSNPFKINQNAFDLIEVPKNLDPLEQIKKLSETAFGQLVTEPRYENAFEETECLSQQEIESILEQGRDIKLFHAPSSRFAFSAEQFFVDGQSFHADESFSTMICNNAITRKLNKQEIEILNNLQQLGAVILLEE